MTDAFQPSPATRAFLDDIRAMRRGDLHVGDDGAPLVRVLRAYQAEDAAKPIKIPLRQRGEFRIGPSGPPQPAPASPPYATDEDLVKLARSYPCKLSSLIYLDKIDGELRRRDSRWARVVRAMMWSIEDYCAKPAPP